MESVPMKRCTDCGKEYPATTDYFYRGKVFRGGLRSNCKTCQNERSRRYRETHREQVNEYKRRRKRTPKAQETWHRYYEANRETILERGRRWRTEHPERIRERLEANREKRRERARNYYQANRKKIREANRKYRQENREKVNENERRRQKNYAEANRLRERRRKTAEYALPFNFTLDDETYAFDYFHGCCAVCGRPLTDLFGEHKPAMDHWIPINDKRLDNPGTVPTNMVPLCHGIGGCNNRKNDCDPVEWLEREFGKRKAAQILKRIEAFFETVRQS